MKTVITSAGDQLTAAFDKRFGRASWFCLFDDETKETKFFVNEHENANNGAGTKAAETMVNLGAKKVISGDFGPKAKELLEQFNIQMVILSDNGLSIASVIDKISR